MHVSSGDKVGIQRYLDRHTYNNDNIPRCRYMIPTLKVYLQAIPTDVSVTILLYFVQNTYIYLHGRYILKKYLLMYVSLSCCIFAGNTFTYCADFRSGFRAGFCAGFCASPSARSRRNRIATASPSHRRQIAGSHRRRIASRASCRLH